MSSRTGRVLLHYHSICLVINSKLHDKFFLSRRGGGGSKIFFCERAKTYSTCYQNVLLMCSYITTGRLEDSSQVLLVLKLSIDPNNLLTK